MIGIVLFVLAIIFGCQLLRRVPLKWSRPEFLAAGTVIGLLLQSWIFFITALLMPYAWSLPLAALLMAGGCLLLFYLPHQSLAFETQWKGSIRTKVVWELFSILIFVLLYYLFYTRMAMATPVGWYSGGASWGDLAIHLTLITHFANQAKLGMDFPLMIGSQLNYPFLIDFLSSIYYRTGMTLQLSLILPSVALAFSFVQLLVFLGYRFFKSLAVGMIAVLLFLFNGSFMGVYYFAADLLRGQVDFMMQDYTNSFERSLHFTNVLICNLLPQRSILFGFAIFCLVLILLQQLWQQKEKPSLSLALVAGFLIGLLPFAHTHTFLTAAFVYGWVGVTACVTQRRVLAAWALGAGVFIVVAAPQFAWQLMVGFHEGFGHWKTGWMKMPEHNLIIFWLRNMGVGFLLLFINLIVVTRYLKDRLHLHLYLPLFFIFLATNVYSFQPNEYDNSKFFLFTYLLAMLYAGWIIVKLAHRSRVLAVFLFLTLTVNGYLAATAEFQRNYLLFTPEDIALANKIRKDTPVDARFLVTDQHNHPVPTLTGRSVVLGYRGWLWSYGMDYSQIEADQSSIFRGEASAEDLLKKYGVSYVVLSTNTSGHNGWAVNEAYFQNKHSLVYASTEWLLFKVNP